MAKSKITSTPAQWGPAESHRSEIPQGTTFIVYAECPFDRLWGMDRWGYEIHGSRTRGVRQDTTAPDLARARVRQLVTLTGTAQIKTTYTEPDRPGWTLPTGVSLTRPFSEAGEALLTEMGLVDQYADTFTPEPKLLRAALLTTCQIAPEMLPTLSGAQIDAILRQHAGALGVVSEMKAGDTTTNRVEWNDADPDYMAKKEALELAVKAGLDHDVEELRAMDYGRLRNLLRRKTCEIRYMVTPSKPPRGKVHRVDWESYIRGVVREHEQIEDIVEKRVRSLA